MELALRKGERDLDNVGCLTQELIRMLLHYRTFKQTIPNASKWFDVIQKHDNWLYPDATKEEMLHRLGVVTQAPTVTDRDWLEKEIVKIFVGALSRLTQDRTSNAFLEFIEILRMYLSNLVQNWEIDQAIDQCQQFEAAVSPLFEMPGIDTRLKLQLLDMIGLSRNEIAVSVRNLVGNFDTQSTVTNVSKFAYGKIREPGFSVPNEVRSTVDGLIRKLRFEKAIEGEWVSPEWYIQQIVARSYA